MAWNDNLIENGWNTPRYGECNIFKSAESYAASFSELTFDLLHNWASDGGSSSNHVTDFRVINDNRFPIFFVLFNQSGETGFTTLDPISPLYSSQCHMDIILNSVDYFHGDVTIQNYPLNEIAQGYPGNYPFSTPNATYQKTEITTNMPIIAVDYDSFTGQELQALRAEYLNNGDLSIFDEYIENETMILLNEAQAPEQKSNLFTIYNTGQLDKWTNAGRTYISGPYYRWARLKLATSDQVDGRFAFYRAGLDDGKIKLIPVSVASVVACEYSTDGGATWQESESFPYDYIYGERVDELGQFISATRTGIGGNTGVPLFATEEEAIGWVNHDPDVSIDQALNYGELGNRYPITNPTGIDETATTMGTNAGIASLFSQKYLCNKSDIEKIARALFDTGAGHIWDDIKEGLDMMGENPINAVCGLQYFPIDLSQVFSRTSSQTYVYFGGYYFKPTDHGEASDLNILKILGFDGFVDLGEFTIERSFTPAEDVRNFEPYCNLQIYLPYIGLQKLSYNKYVGKTIKARYYIDINSGGCLACLFCNDVLMDFFNGNMGVNLPITLTDFAGYAEAQLNNLASFAGVGGNAAGAISAGASGNITGAAGASVASIAGFEKSLYEVSTTNLDQFNTTKGGSSALGNGYLPQYIYLVFEFIQTDETPNLNQLAGRASNASGTLNSFSGYLEIDDIELKTSAGMTENEIAEFISLLHSGIII